MNEFPRNGALTYDLVDLGEVSIETKGLWGPDQEEGQPPTERYIMYL